MTRQQSTYLNVAVLCLKGQLDSRRSLDRKQAEEDLSRLRALADQLEDRIREASENGA